jgi:hypothetical protein
LYALVQTRVRDEQRGRILGTAFAALAGSGIAGMLVAGWLGDAVGIVPLLCVQSAGYVLGGWLVLWQLG